MLSADGTAILVLNSGSSSIKFAVFRPDLSQAIGGSITEIGGASQVRIGDASQVRPVADHETALRLLLAGLAGQGITISGLAAAAHRVVHGGAGLTETCRITASVRQAIVNASPLAPLHNPHNLAGIDALAAAAPELPQFACFDTAFHATNPDVATRYALPDIPEAAGLRRYGFHGTSYAGLVAQWPDLTGVPCPPRLLAMHLGNGASLCAILNGRSVATTMGYSPVDGLTMGTRCGSIDAEAVLRLAGDVGIARCADILNRESGLLGLGGSSDMRALTQGDGARARFALEHFRYWATRHAGSMVAAMGGCDAIAFTGGIGENDATTRRAILNGLGFLGVTVDAQANNANATRLHADDSAVAVWVIPADEERTIARQVLDLMKGGTRTSG